MTGMKNQSNFDAGALNDGHWPSSTCNESILCTLCRSNLLTAALTERMIRNADRLPQVPREADGKKPVLYLEAASCNSR